MQDGKNQGRFEEGVRYTVEGKPPYAVYRLQSIPLTPFPLFVTLPAGCRPVPSLRPSL